jgi:hypothetical protein
MGKQMTGSHLSHASCNSRSQAHRYRALFLNGPGAIMRITAFAASDDKQAVEMMRDMVDGETELWDRSRFIRSYPAA